MFINPAKQLKYNLKNNHFFGIFAFIYFSFASKDIKKQKTSYGIKREVIMVNYILIITLEAVYHFDFN